MCSTHEAMKILVALKATLPFGSFSCFLVTVRRVYSGIILKPLRDKEVCMIASTSALQVVVFVV